MSVQDMVHEYIFEESENVYKIYVPFHIDSDINLFVSREREDYKNEILEKCIDDLSKKIRRINPDIKIKSKMENGKSIYIAVNPFDDSDYAYVKLLRKDESDVVYWNSFNFFLGTKIPKTWENIKLWKQYNKKIKKTIFKFLYP